MRKIMTGRGHVARVPLVLFLIASCLAAGCAYKAEETPAQPASSLATTGAAVARPAALPYPDGAVSGPPESDGTAGGQGDGPATNRAVDFDPDRLIGGVGTQFVPLTDPEFVVAAAADFLDPSDIVIGLSVGDEHRAYPVRQIAYHHIVNDTVGGVPRVITY